MSYFDSNATTPPSAAAREAWVRAANEAWQNPSSPYRSAARVRNLLESARSSLADILGCSSEQVVFNSGATEGINAVFQYCAAHADLKDRPVILSPIEHSCVLAAAKRYFQDRIHFCEVSPAGVVDVDSIAKLLQTEPPALVSVMAANNETGVLQPWREIAEVCRKAGGAFLCDAAQWSGKLPLKNLGSCGFVTASAHKFGGPKGCGFLVVPTSVSDFHGQVGGEQERGLRGGTEDFPGIAAMLAALEAAEQLAVQPEEIATRLTWRREFEESVKRRIPGTRIAGEEADRLWNTVSMVLPIGANERWVRKLDRADFQISTGSACSSGREEPSHVLAALGFARDEAKRAVRISSGWQTSPADWRNLAEALERVFHEMKNDGDSPGSLTEVIQL